MNDNSYITISEFSRRAGVTRQALYSRLNKGLKPYCIEIDGKKMLHISALNLYKATDLDENSSEFSAEQDDENSQAFNQDSINLESTSNGELVDFLREQIAVKDRQLETKDKQIQDLMEQNRQLIESLKAEQILHGRTQQRLEEPEPNNPPVTQDATTERQSTGQDGREPERVQEIPTEGNPPEGQQRADQADEKPGTESKPAKQSFWQRLFGSQ